MADRKEREFIEMRLGIPINRFADFSSYMSTGHKKVWATFRACRIISSIILSATFKIVRKREGENSEDVTRAAGWFLDKPNPFDTWEEIIEMTVFHLELVGNAYWLKDEADLLGRPAAVYPLLPQFMRVIPSATNKVAKYVYHVQGKETEFDPSMIIHFKAVNPSSLLMGMGSIEPSEDLYNKFINRNVLEEKFMENGAQPSGVLIRKDPVENESQWEALKNKWVKNYGGKKNSGKTAFLSGEWTYQKLGLSMSEMQGIENEKWSVEQIFLNHGVPLSVAGIESSANYATARQDEINFRKYKVVPVLDTIISRINTDGFFRGLNESNLVLAYELSGLIDVENIVKEFLPLVKEGAMTRNEMRELCGLPIADNVMLDEFLISANYIPLDMAGFGDPRSAVEADIIEDDNGDSGDGEDGDGKRKTALSRRRSNALRGRKQ
jgi:HK97 family phage portal protein